MNYKSMKIYYLITNIIIYNPLISTNIFNKNSVILDDLSVTYIYIEHFELL